jgi:hypothetical protein
MFNNQMGQLPADLGPKSNKTETVIIVRKLDETAKK